IEVHDLIARDLPDLAVERALLHILANARSSEEVFIINGREPGTLTAALNGDSPGTRIYKG
ncbi:MAG: uridine kinase, partial [Anaerolineae bacterium]|nr:uridine kinase [Anaerolineae bacterium]